MNRKNLITLYNGLLSVANGSFVPIFEGKPVELNMGYFSYSGDGYEPHCGSAGCAVGFAPLFGLKKRRSENWFTYSGRIFNLNDDISWNWCFGENWSGPKYGTAAHAAQRIRHLLSGRPIPPLEGWGNWHKKHPLPKRPRPIKEESA